jgi:hypothetical protein
MRKILQQLRKQRALLDRAIRTLEALETLNTVSHRESHAGGLDPSNRQPALPGVVIFPGSESAPPPSPAAPSGPRQRTSSRRP